MYYLQNICSGAISSAQWLANKTTGSITSTTTTTTNASTEATNTILGKVAQLTSGCQNKEKLSAEQILAIHNLIEEVAYVAFADIVKELGITTDEITREQSGKILAYIKMKAHVQMYKKDEGYIAQRTKLLERTQVLQVIQNVGKIVHDRDTKLTDACYPTLSSMLMGLDDHNTMVKEILIKSWFKLDQFSDKDHGHLNQIKEKVGFYEKMDAQLAFDLKTTLAVEKAFWDNCFPGMRLATDGGCSGTDTDRSRNFVDTLEIRHRFKATCLELTAAVQDIPLIEYLTKEDAAAFFEPRHIQNLVRNTCLDHAPLLTDRKITVQQFMTRYFPEKM